MLNVGISRLPHLLICGGMELELEKFVSILHDRKTHLKELSIFFQVRNS